MQPPKLALLAVTACVSAPAPAALDERACRLELESLPAVLAQCADLTVPVDFDDPSGATISLAVARIPALTATPVPDPLLLINGGPGGSSIDLYLQARGAFEPLRRDRDIVLVDQRGTGRSRGGLECEVPGDLDLETASSEQLRAAVAACVAALDIDPRFFTTSAAVRDLDLLRAALGVAQWNLYGVSYGTRVAQHYLRRHPERVRAAVLDGVVPAELALGPEVAANAQEALDRVFANCAADPPCAQRFGALDRKFAELRRRLAANPVSIEVPDPLTSAHESAELGITDLQAVIRLMSYSAPTIALLPLVIDQAHAGDYVPLAAQAQILIEPLGDSLSFPMHNSVVCAEDAPFFRAGRSPEPDATYLGTSVLDALVAICAAWPEGTRDDDIKSAVASDTPVLLLSGELDPVTPPRDAERAIAGGLRNARHLVAPGQGHGVAGVGCVPLLIRDFLATPAPADLVAECLEIEPPVPFFVGFHGPAP